MKYISKFIILLIMATSLTGCTKPPGKEVLTKTEVHFDTIVSIQIFDSDDESLLEDCFSYCEAFERQISCKIETSEISRINSAGGKPVTVSDTTIELLEKGIEYGTLTGGKFDITIAPLSELWDFKNNTQVPDLSQIEEARSHVNYKNIVIKGNQVTLTDPEAAIDLGGIAKGYMADQLKVFLEKNGVKSALINLGGNILTIGKKPDGTNFHIGIQKPFDKKNTAITSVQVNNQSVVSSGIDQRYFETDNQIYHHIIDPDTGFPYDNGLLSVSIISDHSVDGDALSTSCFALGLEEGMNLIRSMEHVDAIFITKDYQIHSTLP